MLISVFDGRDPPPQMPPWVDGWMADRQTVQASPPQIRWFRCRRIWIQCALLAIPPTLPPKPTWTAPSLPSHSLDQSADAPVTVLSLGRSLLKETVDVTLPLRPTAPLGEPCCHGGWLANARNCNLFASMHGSLRSAVGARAVPARPACWLLIGLPRPHTRPILLTALPLPPLSPPLRSRCGGGGCCSGFC